MGGIEIVTNTPTADSDGAQMMGLLAMGDELEVTKLETGEIRSDETRKLRHWK